MSLRRDGKELPAGPLRVWPWLLLGLVVSAGYLAVEALLLSFDFGLPLDDGWIHLQFARNLFFGHGLSYNPGELVTGSTAPLWTALVSVLFWLPGSAMLWAKALGVALHLLSIAAVHRLGRELGLTSGLAGLAAGLYLGTSWMVWSALSGMEIPLFVLLSLWAVICHLRERRQPERPPVSLALFGLALLARPEGALLLLLALADRLLVWRRQGAALALVAPPWRRLLAGLALAALAALPVLLLFTAIGGSPLPTTFAAKTMGSRSWGVNGQYLYTVLGILLRPQPVMTLLAGAGVLALVRRLGRRGDCGLLPALWPLALPLAYSLLAPPGGSPLVGNFGRYFFPLFPFVILLGCLGLSLVAGRCPAFVQLGRQRLPLRALLLGAVCVPTAITLIQGSAFYAQNVANVQDSDVHVARWVRAHLPPEAVLAVQDVGAVKFLTPNPVVDLWGLVHPQLLRYLAEARSAEDPVGRRGMNRFLAEQRPDYLILFPDRYPELLADYHAQLQPVYEVRIRGNITMSSDRLVVYATPWTRYPPHASKP